MKLLLLLNCCFVALGLQAQEVPFIKSPQIEQWKNAENDTVYVLNFWATWCGPCVAELPAFEKITKHFAGQKVQVILISTDFKREVESKVKPFVKRKKLQSKVVFMDEPTPNKWINMVNPNWSGAIPATLVVCKNRGFEQFFEQQLEYEVLEQTVESALLEK